MRIFVSYTTRNNEITREILLSFSSKLSLIGNVFIDMLDNNSEEKQQRIIEELNISDLLVLIESPSSSLSEWVNFELSVANKMKIPIVKLSVSNIDDLTIDDLKYKLEALHSHR